MITVRPVSDSQFLRYECARYRQAHPTGNRVFVVSDDNRHSTVMLEACHGHPPKVVVQIYASAQAQKKAPRGYPSKPSNQDFIFDLSKRPPRKQQSRSVFDAAVKLLREKLAVEISSLLSTTTHE